MKLIENSLSEWLTFIEKTLKTYPISNYSLERIKKVAEPLGLLQKSAYLITITGTNGKGSCAEMLTSVYVAAGYRVGTYTSPHLLRFNERVRIQQQPVSDNMLCEAFSVVEKARTNTALTYFEFITLSALWIFKQANVQIMILEVGIGGRLDATNILDADLAIITSIGLDHTDYLGETREAIGFEKAGILRQEKMSVCGDPEPPITLMQAVKQLKVCFYQMGKDFSYVSHAQTWDFHYANNNFSNLPLPKLAVNNAAVVLQAILLLQETLPVELTEAITVLTQTRLPGRCEVHLLPSGARLIMDVAHNPQAAEHLSHFLETYKKQNIVTRVVAIFSMLVDKDIVATLNSLKGMVDIWHTVEINHPRRASKEKLLDAFKKCYIAPCWHDNLETVTNLVKEEKTQTILWLVVGSFYLCHDVWMSLEKDSHEESHHRAISKSRYSD